MEKLEKVEEAIEEKLAKLFELLDWIKNKFPGPLAPITTSIVFGFFLFGIVPLVLIIIGDFARALSFILVLIICAVSTGIVVYFLTRKRKKVRIINIFLNEKEEESKIY